MMINSVTNKHDSIKLRTAEKYKQQGFEVIVEPRIDELPFNLGRYRPDLLVKKSEHEGSPNLNETLLARLIPGPPG